MSLSVGVTVEKFFYTGEDDVLQGRFWDHLCQRFPDSSALHAISVCVESRGEEYEFSVLISSHHANDFTGEAKDMYLAIIDFVLGNSDFLKVEMSLHWHR